MQKHPRVSDSIEIEQQPATLPAFQREMAFVSDPEQARRYAGQWVALDRDKVVAAGPRPKEVLAEAETLGHNDSVLHYFPLRDPDMLKQLPCRMRRATNMLIYFVERKIFYGRFEVNVR